MKRLLTAAAVLAIVASGCSRGDKFRVEENRALHPPIPMRVAIQPFEDARGFERRANRTLEYIPLMPYSAYHYDRYDEASPGVIEPFPTLMPSLLERRFATVPVFESATYFEPGTEPVRGEQDLVLRGKLLELSGKGGRSRYGLSIFGDLLWYLGLPNQSRYWVADMEFQLENAYTGVPVGEPVKVQQRTDKRFFTVYGDLTNIDELTNGMDRAWDDLITQLWATQPEAASAQWAELRREGQQVLAREASDADFARKGTPPTFSFLSPAKGERVRGATTTVRWSLTAPGGLKQVALVVNNQPVDIGVNPLDLMNAEKAPRNLSARDLQVPLRLGANRFDVLVADHRGNETRSDFELLRVPSELFPARRAALVVGSGSPILEASARRLGEQLGDPLVGQLDDATLTVATPASLDRATLKGLLDEFTGRRVGGELAFIYIAAKGDAATKTIAGGYGVLDMVKDLGTSLATDDVVLVLDIDWNGEASGELLREWRGELPRQWAVVVGESSPRPAKTSGGATALAAELSRALAGDANSRGMLSLERLLDQAFAGAQSLGAEPAVAGSYNPSITMAARE